MSGSPGEQVRALAWSLGFDHVSFTGADPAAHDGAFLARWCAEGKAAGMGWLARDPARRAAPAALLPEARSVISLGVTYFQGPVPAAPAGPAGRVARYAWGADYHAVLEARLEVFRSRLSGLLGPEVLSRPAVDAQPLLERAFARRGGLGFVGKNTNVIRPGGGSYLFLADLLVNLPLPADAPRTQGCGACARCAVACPTGALDVPYSLDARLCLAYHTIENRGWIPREIRPRMKNWVFGCDDCQDPCPYNARSRETLWPEFRAERGPGAWVSLGEILSLRAPEPFKARYRGTSLLRAKRAGLVRNACVAAANGGRVEELEGLLDECLRADGDPVVRGHAAWALGRGGKRDRLERARAGETDPLVQQEITAALEGRP